MAKFKAIIKDIHFKRSYGDAVIRVTLEPCYILDKKDEDELLKFWKNEGLIFDVEIKKEPSK